MGIQTLQKTTLYHENLTLSGESERKINISGKLVMPGPNFKRTDNGKLHLVR